MSRTPFQYTFPVADAVSLTVRNPVGSIEIESWDRPEVSISGSHEEDTRVEASQENGRVTVRSRTDEWPFVFRRHIHADIRIRMPRKCDLNCSTVSGTIRVQGVSGSAHMSAVDGTIRVSDLEGSLDTDCVNGRVVGNRVRGEVRVHTTNGNVVLDDSEVRRLKADMVNGDVRVETPIFADGEYEGNAMNGRMTLIVPPDTRCSVVLTTLSGRIRTSLPGDIRRRIGVAEAEINGGGGPTIRFNTVNGDLVLRSADEREAMRSSENVRTAARDAARSMVDDLRAATHGASEEMRTAAREVARSVAEDARIAAREAARSVAEALGAADMPEPPEPPCPPEHPGRPPRPRRQRWTRMEVLRAVEKGEITVDEAMAELRELQ